MSEPDDERRQVFRRIAEVGIPLPAVPPVPNDNSNSWFLGVALLAEGHAALLQGSLDEADQNLFAAGNALAEMLDISRVPPRLSAHDWGRICSTIVEQQRKIFGESHLEKSPVKRREVLSGAITSFRELCLTLMRHLDFPRFSEAQLDLLTPQALPPQSPSPPISQTVEVGASSPIQAAVTHANLPSMYEAFVGPAKAQYYLAVFKQFDADTGVVSWNWPAALVPQLWMVYRGMFLWEFLWYPIFSSVASIAIAWTAPGSTGAIYVLSRVTCVITMGMFGNKLFQRHVRKKIAESDRLGLSDLEQRRWLTRKGGGHLGLACIWLTIQLTFIATVGALMLHGYQGRAKMAESITHTRGARTGGLRVFPHLASEPKHHSPAPLGR